MFSSDFTTVSSANTMTVSIYLSNVINPLSVRLPLIGENLHVSTYYSGSIVDGFLVQRTAFSSTICLMFSSYLQLDLGTLGFNTSGNTIR